MKLLAIFALALAAAVAPSGASASVGNTDMEICNAVTSTSLIWPHELPTGWGNYGTSLAPGACRVYHNNTGQLRVYVPNQSYRYGQPNQGYGDCKNAPWDSDPPNSANGSRETYHSYRYDGCVD